MSSSSEDPFQTLVHYLRTAFAATSSDPIRIPVELDDVLKKTTPPYEASDLRDLVSLFESNEKSRFRLAPEAFFCLVQIVFYSRSSLSQQRLLHLVFSPFEPLDGKDVLTWRKSISPKLIPCFLRLLPSQVVDGRLLITVTQCLLSLLDSENKRAVFDGEDALRRTLGLIVRTHNSYAFRIAVANVIRELLVGKDDRHLFWPKGTPSEAYLKFPLAPTANARWMTGIVEYLSEVIAAKAFRGEPPSAYHVHYPEAQSVALAVVSQDIVLILPGDSRLMHFIELPIAEGITCELVAEDSVQLQYGNKPGYRIIEGIKSAIQEVELIFKDNTQRTGFAQSVYYRQVDKNRTTPLNTSGVLWRMSSASIDFSRSSEISVGSESDTGLHSDSQRSSPSGDTLRFEAAAKASHIRQERSNQIELPHLSHINSPSGVIEQMQISSDRSRDHTSTDLEEPDSNALPASSHRIHPVPERLNQSKGKTKLGLGQQSKLDSGEQKTTTLPTMVTQAIAIDSQRQLKRPNAKGVGNTSSNDVDWDQDLREDESESEVPLAKKLKNNSKKTSKVAGGKTGKARKAAKSTSHNQKTTTGNRPNTTAKSKATSIKTIASTRTRRSAAIKSAKYIEDSESDNHNSEEEDVPAKARDSKLARLKRVALQEKEIQVGDSQRQDISNPPTSNQLNEVEASTAIDVAASASPNTRKVDDHEPEGTAQDSHPMDTTEYARALAHNRTSFGSKMALLLGKELQPQPVADLSSKTSFGNAKTFLETVNTTRSSPQKQSLRKIPKGQSNGEHPQSPAFVSAQEAAEPSVQVPSTSTIVSQTRPGTKTWLGNEAPDQSEDMQPTHHVLDKGLASGEQSVYNNSKLLAVKKTTQMKVVTTAVATKAGKENRTFDTKDQMEMSDAAMAKPTVAAAKASPRNPFPRSALKEIPRESRPKQAMAPPPRPQSHIQPKSTPRSSKTIPIDNEASAFIMYERIQSKTPIVSFSARGPRNQGIISPGNPSTIAGMSSDAPLKRRKSIISKQPTAVLEGLKDNAPEPVEATHTSEESRVISDNDGILVNEESAIVPPITRNSSRGSFGRTASHKSKVDENGSPRLLQPHEDSHSSASVLELTANLISEQFENSAASEELKNSEYANDSGSSPAPPESEQLQGQPTLGPQPSMARTRGSIGIDEIVSKKFPHAAKIMNTKVFKAQVEARQSPVVVQQSVTMDRPVQKVQEAVIIDSPAQHIMKVVKIDRTFHEAQKAMAIDRPLEKAQDHPPVDSTYGKPIIRKSAPSSPKKLPESAQATRVERLDPKTPTETFKENQKTSPTPASFNTAFKSMLMPPPPLPFQQTRKPDAMAPPVQEGTRSHHPRTEDAEMTLVEEPGFPGHRNIRPSLPNHRRQSSDSSSDSESSQPSTPPGMDCRTKYLVPKTMNRRTQARLADLLDNVVHQALFRLHEAEKAIGSKANEFHSGCQETITELTNTYEAHLDHEKSKAAPLIAELRTTYGNVIEKIKSRIESLNCGTDLVIISEEIDKRRKHIFALVETQMEGSRIGQ